MVYYFINYFLNLNIYLDLDELDLEELELYFLLYILPKTILTTKTKAKNTSACTNTAAIFASPSVKILFWPFGIVNKTPGTKTKNKTVGIKDHKAFFVRLFIYILNK